MLKTILETAGIAVNEAVISDINEEAFLDGVALYEDDGIVAYDTYLLTARYLDALIKAKSKERLFAGKYSRSYIMSVYHYNPATGLFKSVKTGHVMGTNTTHKKHYLKLHLEGDTYLAHRIAHFLMTGKDTKLLIDHIDGDHYNNRISNLRLATHSENGQNRRHTKPNGSGSCIPGVTYFKQMKKWRVLLRKDGKLNFFGYFKTQAEAEAHAIQVRTDNFPFYIQ